MNHLYNESVMKVPVRKKVLEGNVLLALVFIIFLVGLGLYFLKQINLNQKEVYEQAKKLEAVDLTLREDFVKVVVADPNTKKVELTSLQESETMGKIYVLRRDNSFYLVSQVDFPEPEDGFMYEGWVGKERGDENLFSLGVFEKLPDFPYILEYAAEGEFPEYSYFLITKERYGDSEPETKLMEADF